MFICRNRSTSSNRSKHEKLRCKHSRDSSKKVENFDGVIVTDNENPKPSFKCRNCDYTSLYKKNVNKHKMLQKATSKNMLRM